MTQEQKYFTVGAVGVGLFILYRLSKKASATRTTTNSEVIPHMPLSNSGSQSIGKALTTTVGIRNPIQVTWNDFNTLIQDSSHSLSGMTSGQLLDQQSRANIFLKIIGWDGVYDNYRVYLKNELLNNEISFALNINGGFSLSPTGTESVFAPAPQIFAPISQSTAIVGSNGVLTVETGGVPTSVLTQPNEMALAELAP